VVSHSGNEYLVDLREGRCSCPDAEYNLDPDEPCKHELRAALYAGRLDTTELREKLDATATDLEHSAEQLREKASDLESSAHEIHEAREQLKEVAGHE
jgi:predicted nucleic acid-binding Zn finger protein